MSVLLHICLDRNLCKEYVVCILGLLQTPMLSRSVIHLLTSGLCQYVMMGSHMKSPCVLPEANYNVIHIDTASVIIVLSWEVRREDTGGFWVSRSFLRASMSKK